MALQGESAAAEALPQGPLPQDWAGRLDEEGWYQAVQRNAGAPQLTFRAVAMGSVLGFFLALMNLYVGLKTGWHVGVDITACILSYTLWTGLQRLRLVRGGMTILENNCMQSTVSSAGLTTGGEMVSAITALLLLSVTTTAPGGTHLPWLVLAAWTALVALLGVSLAIPMKRRFINQERLPFPSGVACAATLRSLYASGASAVAQGRALLWAALFGGLFPLLLDLRLLRGVDGVRRSLVAGFRPVFDGWLPVPGQDRVTGVPFLPSSWNMGWDLNPVMVAGGMLVGIRVSGWMLAGSLALVFAIGPLGLDAAMVGGNGQTVWATTDPSTAWRELGLWLGAPIIVAAGLMSFGLRLLASVRARLRRVQQQASTTSREIEVPFSWFLAGAGVAGLGLTGLAWAFFGVPPHYGLLAVGLSYVLAMVAARATGESDITPTGALGKVTQLSFGMLMPQAVEANLMTAFITAGSSASAADLLNDLKAGYLLGARPRQQFIAQLLGIVAGTVATVAGFHMLVPDASVLMESATASPIFPAPAARIWLAVAETFRTGLGGMHPMHARAVMLGLAVGTVLAALEWALPRRRRWIPSATGLGMGLFLPFPIPFSLVVGALLGLAWRQGARDSSEAFLVPVASGVIAGVSVMGVLVACIDNFVLGP